MADAYLDYLEELENSPDLVFRLRGFSALADEYYWRHGLLEAIAEIEKLRRLIYLYVDPDDSRPEDQAAIDAVVAWARGEDI